MAFNINDNGEWWVKNSKKNDPNQHAYYIQKELEAEKARLQYDKATAIQQKAYQNMNPVYIQGPSAIASANIQPGQVVYANQSNGQWQVGNNSYGTDTYRIYSQAIEQKAKPAIDFCLKVLQLI